jgi:hypothetical protein
MSRSRNTGALFAECHFLLKSLVYFHVYFTIQRQFTGTLDTTIGICPDVLVIYIKAKPNLSYSLGSFMVDLFYEMEYTGYTADTGINPITRHTVGLGGMLLF